MSAAENHILIDAGPFGPWGSGHSHSDTLSIVARSGDHEILIDPGTYTYVADPGARNWFRGSAAHNTIRVDGLDQAKPVNPFRWSEQPGVSIRIWKSTEKEDFLEAECVSRGVTHRRRVRFLKPDLLLIADEVFGPPGEHLIEQFWHLASARQRDQVVLETEPTTIDSWQSGVFGAKRPSFCLCVRKKTSFPALVGAAIYLGDSRRPVDIENDATLRFRLSDPGEIWEIEATKS